MKKGLAILMSLALLGVFAISAGAAEWGFYGSSRIATFYTSQDFGDQEDPDGDADLEWYQQSNSRIGANVSGGPIKGRFEYGTGVNLRQLWGEYDFGGMQLRIGQEYTPMHSWTSLQVYGEDENLCGIGTLYGSRKDQIKLIAKGFELALIEQNTDDLGTGGEIDTMLPKVEAAYRTNVGPGSVGIMGGYSGYRIESADQEDDVQINSWGIQAEGLFSFGPAYVNASAFVAGNYGNYGGAYDIAYLSSANGNATNYNSCLPASAAVVTDWDSEDAASWGGSLVVGFASSETMTFEAGLGYTSHKNDDVGDGDADNTLGVYLQADILVGQGFSVIPEIGHFAFGDDASGNDTGSLTYAGAKWQMNF